MEPTTTNEATFKKIDLSKFINKVVFWIGAICAVISLFAYILIVTVMVVGFKANANLVADIAFALVNAAVGVIIAQFLKVQGVTFAKSEPEVKLWLDRWSQRRTADRKYHSMKRFWWLSVIKDIVIKGILIAVLTIGSVYIFVEASNDIMKILMALFNIIMFIGFGFMSLTSAYNYMREEHVEWIKVQIESKFIDEENAAKEKQLKEDQLFVSNIHEIATLLGSELITTADRKEQQFVDSVHQYVLQLIDTKSAALVTAVPELPEKSEPGKGG